MKEPKEQKSDLKEIAQCKKNKPIYLPPQVIHLNDVPKALGVGFCSSGNGATACSGGSGGG